MFSPKLKCFKPMNNQVILAQFCFIARFNVARSAVGEHLVQRGWKKLFSSAEDKELFSGKAIQQHISAYLGGSREQEGFVSNGGCYTAQVCDLLSAFNNKAIYLDYKKSGRSLSFYLNPTLQIHLSPDNHAGLFVIAFDLPSRYPDMYSMEEVINLNYALQKIDNQAPKLLLDNTGAVPGFETLPAIFRVLLPEDDVSIPERFRLHPAVYIQTPPVPGSDYDELVYLASGQNIKYLITNEDRDAIEALFQNIHTICRREGFAVCSENPDPTKENTFESQFLSTFRGSYLPLYLHACLVDCSLLYYLHEMAAGRISGNQSEQLRELKLAESLSPSPFSHLNKLSGSINQSVFNLPSKVESISEYLDNARFETRSRSEKRLNLCVLALTLSQVVFVLIQYLGVRDVLGEQPQPLQAYSWIIVAVTLLIVGALIVPWEKMRRH